MTTPADTRISDADMRSWHERLTEQIRLLRIRLDKTAITEDAMQYSELLSDAEFKLALITELRERRAQAVTVKPLEWREIDRAAWLGLRIESGPYVIQQYKNGDGSLRTDLFDVFKNDTGRAVYRATGLGEAKLWAGFDAALAAPPPAQAAGVTEERHGIYIASKTKHAQRWRFLRDTVGEPVISTWIDEAGQGESGDLADLWRRCIHEASHAEVLILYREPDEVLKGGWIELGAALAAGVKVFAVGIDEFTVAHDTRIERMPDMKSAVAAQRAYRAALSAQDREE